MINIQTAYDDIRNNLGNHAKDYYYNNRQIFKINQINNWKYSILYSDGGYQIVNKSAIVEVINTK